MSYKRIISLACALKLSSDENYVQGVKHLRVQQYIQIDTRSHLSSESIPFTVSARKTDHADYPNYASISAYPMKDTQIKHE